MVICVASESGAFRLNEASPNKPFDPLFAALMKASICMHRFIDISQPLTLASLTYQIRIIDLPGNTLAERYC